MEGYLAMAWVSAGVLVWGAVFLLARWSLPNRSYDFVVRLVSTLHALLIVVLAALSVRDWRCPVCPAASPPSPFQAMILVVALSHMIYDTVCCFFHPKIQWDSYAHHIVSILAIGAVLICNKGAPEVVASLLITEVSSPFLHCREMLKELGFRGTPFNTINDVLFAVTFSTARMVAGPFIVYAILTADNPIILKAMALGLMLVSIYWFYKIAKMMYFKSRRWFIRVDEGAVDKTITDSYHALEDVAEETSNMY